MPVNEFHRQVAAIVLRVAAEYGFAVGGGTALIAHGIVDRYTADLDLVSPRERAAARHRRAFRPACIKAPAVSFRRFLSSPKAEQRSIQSAAPEPDPLELGAGRIWSA